MITHLQERAIISRMFITCMNLATDPTVPKRGFRPSIEDMLIASAIIVGEAEKRPMSASDIAAYVNLPRATVWRRLKIMQFIGAIEFSKDGARSPVIIKNIDHNHYMDRMIKAVHQASAELLELSKMDT